MTKEKLEKEAEEYALKQWEGNLPWSVIQKSYYDGALPREKRIKHLEESLLDVTEKSVKRIAELEAQIEKMKEKTVSLCEGCVRLPMLYKELDKEIKEK